MAILYSKIKKTSEAPTHGFDISFTDGTTYDLDHLVHSKDRNNPNATLVLKVIDDKATSDRILSEIMSTLRTTISDVINDDTVRQGISKIMADVISRYGLTTADTYPSNIYTILTNEINEYLKGVFDAYGVNYQVLFFDATRADISYSFTDTDSIEQMAQERLNFYLTKYKNELSDVKEGSLAITTSGKRRAVGADDYKKYLLGEEFGKEKSEEGYIKPLTGRRPIVMWEDGTQDNTGDGEEAIDIYGSIKDMSEVIAEHSLKIDSQLAVLGKFGFQAIEVGLDTGMENDLSDIEGFAEIKRHVVLLKD